MGRIGDNAADIFVILAIILIFPPTHAVLGALLIIFALASKPSSGGGSFKFAFHEIIEAAGNGDLRALAMIGGILLIIVFIIELLFI